jgi:hypothetical protein
MLSASSFGPTVVVANIVSPTPGQSFSTTQQIDVVGTAAFSPDQAAYYKVEIKGGQWAEFATIGDVNNPRNQGGVTNGVLESLPAYAVPPGDYILQLVIVGRDGNWLQAPYQVPFRVTG